MVDCIHILIQTEDREYGEALGLALANLSPDFRVSCGDFDGVGEGDTWDLVLVDEAGFPGFRRCFPGEKLVILTETPPVPEGEVSQGEGGRLYRYMGLRKLAGELRFLYARISGKSVTAFAGGEGVLTGFYSFCGGAGKSVLALSAARELAFYHRKRVLYLSLEEWESTEPYFPAANGRRTVSDYLYYLFSGRDAHLADPLDSFLMKDAYGVEAFPSSVGRNELRELNEGELCRFLETLWQKRRYHHILLDLSADGRPETLYLLNCCQKVFCIAAPGYVGRFREQRAMEYLNRQYGEDLTKKFISVLNFWDGKELPQRGIPVERDDESFSDAGEYLQINLNRTFGLGVKKIVSELTGTL